MSAMHYLRYVFSASGMSPDPNKVQVVLDWPAPTNSTEICQFLGLTSYYRQYIPPISPPHCILLHKLAQPSCGQKTVLALLKCSSNALD